MLGYNGSSIGNKPVSPTASDVYNSYLKLATKTDKYSYQKIPQLFKDECNTRQDRRIPTNRMVSLGGVFGFLLPGK